MVLKAAAAAWREEARLRPSQKICWTRPIFLCLPSPIYQTIRDIRKIHLPKGLASCQMTIFSKSIFPNNWRCSYEDAFVEAAPYLAISSLATNISSETPSFENHNIFQERPDNKSRLQRSFVEAVVYRVTSIKATGINCKLHIFLLEKIIVNGGGRKEGLSYLKKIANLSGKVLILIPLVKEASEGK